MKYVIHSVTLGDIEKLFRYMSAPYWPINPKFGTEMKDRMPIYVA